MEELPLPITIVTTHTNHTTIDNGHDDMNTNDDVHNTTSETLPIEMDDHDDDDDDDDDDVEQGQEIDHLAISLAPITSNDIKDSSITSRSDKNQNDLSIENAAVASCFCWGSRSARQESASTMGGSETKEEVPNNNDIDHSTTDKSNTYSHLIQRQRACHRRVVLSVLALLIVVITAPFVVQSFKRRNNNNNNQEGNNVDDTHTKPDDNTTDTTATPAPGTSTITIPSDNENNGDQPEKELSNTSSSSNNNPPFLLPFDNVQLPYFTQDIVQGYNHTEEFEFALTQAAQFLVNKIVLRNLGQTSISLPTTATTTTSSSGGWGPDSIVSGTTNTWRGAGDEDGSDESAFFTTTSNIPGGDVTAYETNNQEAGIDEADVLQASDSHVYAAYNNYILVWDLNGNQVAQAEMPTLEQYNDDDDDQDDASSNNNNNNYFGGTIFSSPVTSSSSSGQAHIESLLLVGDRLVVIVSHGRNRDNNSQNNNTGNDRTVLMDHLGTQIRIYKTLATTTRDLNDANEELTLVGTKIIHGRFLDAKSIDNQVHVTTTSGIDTYNHLAAPFERFSNFPDLTDEEYVAQVKIQAEETYIPQFVQKLRSELTYFYHNNVDDDAILPNLLQVNRWQSLLLDGDSSTASSNSRTSRSDLEDQMYTQGVINSVAFVTSFNATAPPQTDASPYSHGLVTSTSAFLAPSQHVQVYGTESKLVLATRAWDWNNNQDVMEEVTHLVLLSFNNDNKELVSTSFHSLGTVRGYVLNPYSMDVLNNELRVATTITNRWGYRAQPQQVSGNTVQMGTNHQETQMTDRSVGVEDDQIVQESTTENYITVLNIENSLQHTGVVQLGGEDEIIMSVRFFDKVAYCVTFRQADPFYVVDLDKMEVIGNFKVNGFSNYLHPLDQDNRILVGIGQNATDEGVVNGFMITVFNATKPTRPEVLVSYTVDDSPLGGTETTQSVAQWDYKSFRYVDGKVIVPLNTETYTTEGSTDDAIKQTLLGSFEGFVIFNVSPEAISEHFRVSHATLGCNYCGYLPPRSVVYNGNVMTVQGNIVSSANLYSAQEEWAFHVEVEGGEPLCCY